MTSRPHLTGFVLTEQRAAVLTFLRLRRHMGEEWVSTKDVLADVNSTSRALGSCLRRMARFNVVKRSGHRIKIMPNGYIALGGFPPKGEI